MRYYNIQILRKISVEELSGIKIKKPILLPFDKELLQKLIFDDGRFSKYIPSPVLFKIDFSNISFDGYDLQNSVKNFEGFTGIKINPQTIIGRNLKGANCADVEFVESFDGVCVYKTNFEENFRQKIKSLV